MSTTMSCNGVKQTSSRRAKATPKLKESCDCCAQAKVRCTRERPSCLRCRTKGNHCQYSYSRRAGRKTMSSTTASTTPSESNCSSYHGSPHALPSKPSFAHMERTMSASSSSSARSTPSTPVAGYHRLPIPTHEHPIPQLARCHEQEEEDEDLHLNMWSHPSFATTSDDLDEDWYHLTDHFPQTSPPPTTTTTHFFHSSNDPHHTTTTTTTTTPPSPTASSTDSLLLEPLEPFPMFDDDAPPHEQDEVDDDPHHQQNDDSILFFAETEAIREELRLVAQFVGDLEARVDRSVRCAELQQKAARDAMVVCGDFSGAEGLVARFDAEDLRRRLGELRREVECIVGFG